MKSIYTNPKHPYDPRHTKKITFIITLKSIPTNLKYLGAISAHRFSQILKKGILANLKTPRFTLIIILKERIHIKTII